MPLDTSPRSFAAGDVHAAGQMGIMQRHGHEIANGHIVRAGDDLDGDFPPTSTWQMFRWSELGCLTISTSLPTTTLLDLRAAVLIASTAVPPAHDHAADEFLDRQVDLDIFFKPRKRYEHRLHPPFFRTAPGNAGHFQTADAYRARCT